MTIANRSRLEQETIINFNEEEKVASVYTFNKTLQRRLAKLAEQYPDDCKREFDTWQPEGSVDYTVPKKWIKINPPRFVSDKQKALSSLRMKAMQARKREQN